MKTIFAFVIYFLAYSVQANENKTSFSIDIGESRDNIKIYRLGVQYDISDWLYNKGFPAQGYFESSLNYWKSAKHDIYGIAFSPVFKFSLCEQCENAPYFEIGVGVSLISKKIIETRDMSSHFQFEDRIGLGFSSGNINYHVRYMHYSNAGLAQPNHGIDIFIAGMAFKF